MKKTYKNIKSPLNYIGGKYKLLNQITPLFPAKINIFELSKTNENGYKEFRNFYNKTKITLDLFVLIAYSFNHQIRFNKIHEFNNPFGKNRSSFNSTMKNNLINFILKLKVCDNKFTYNDFKDFNFSQLSNHDFVYCDPPYLITTGSYNDGKRGFKGWTEIEEIELLNTLDTINNQNIKFALSNVIQHKGIENIILINWLKKNNYKINFIHKSYANSNYQTKIRDKNSSVEVLITNYNPTIKNYQLSLFDLQ